jgi:hypothetical protein
MIAPNEVFKEVSLQKDLCRKWCQQHYGIFRSINNEIAKYMENEVKPVYDKKVWKDNNTNDRP